MNKIKIFESSFFQEEKVEDRVNKFLERDDIIVKDIQMSAACTNSTKTVTVMVWYKEE